MHLHIFRTFRTGRIGYKVQMLRTPCCPLVWSQILRTTYIVLHGQTRFSTFYTFFEHFEQVETGTNVTNMNMQHASMLHAQQLGVGFDSNSKWFLNGQYSVCFRIEYSNRIEYFIRTIIMYVYVDSPSQERRKVRDSTYV
jgi:hypothetical protein